MQQRKPYLHEDWIDPHALKIVQTLQREGFETYLVGGCVRDLLVGIHPKDFDIATSAHPPQIKKLIHRSNIIGRRFRLVLVRRFDSQFEISTFRRNQIVEELEAEAEAEADVEIDSNKQEDRAETQKIILNDNFFGTAKEDASRRDFTVNSLFYDPSVRKIVDHCHGLRDIEQNIIRMIGDPYLRFIEDPIRILRAIRLSHKIGFKLDPLLRAAIPKTAMELKKSVLPRRREEYLKILKLEDPLLALFEIYDLQVMDVIFPSLSSVFLDPKKLEIFSNYFKRFKESKMDSKDSTQLFSHFLMSYLTAQLGEGELKLDVLYKDRDVINFMKDEIGMFKAESALFFKALELMPSLRDIDYFLRKGERRRKGFLKSEGLELALSFGRLEYSLSPGVLQFWENQL